MGVMGNKGGVGIRLRLRSSSLCFITCHLAAHRENVKARNENYQKVTRLSAPMDYSKAHNLVVLGSWVKLPERGNWWYIKAVQEPRRKSPSRVACVASCIEVGK